MSVKDYFKTSLLLLRRGKKKLIYTLVIFVCVIITISVLIFNINFEKLLNHMLTNDPGLRTVILDKRYLLDSTIGEEEQLKKDLTDLLNIEHVVDAFDTIHRETFVISNDLASTNLDGAITLHRGTPNSLPNIIAGRAFEEGETGVAIIPVSFFPSLEPQFVNRKQVIDGNTLLGTTFTVQYHDYIKDKNGMPQENQTFSKEFKIVGLYDTAERLHDSGFCYIPAQDLIEITETQASWWKIPTEEVENSNSLVGSMGSALCVVVDNINNVGYVIEQSEALGFEYPALATMMDMQFIAIVRIVITLILFLSLFTTIIITISYAKKKINSEEKNIAILRASGYTKRETCNIYALESFIYNMLIYIIGVIIMLITFFVAIYNIPILGGLDLMMGGIEINIFSFIFAFFVVVIIPVLVIGYNIIRKCNIDIVNLLGSEE